MMPWIAVAKVDTVKMPLLRDARWLLVWVGSRCSARDPKRGSCFRSPPRELESETSKAAGDEATTHLISTPDNPERGSTSHDRRK